MDDTGERRFLALYERVSELSGKEEKPLFAPEGLQQLRDAYDYALRAHGTQTRDSGELYIIHPIATAEILLELGVHDLGCLIAALLHDVLEDTSRSAQELEKRFGATVTGMVQALTKSRRVHFQEHEKESQQALDFLNLMLGVSNNDYRVLFVKLADRLHNMRTLQFKKEEARRRIANETMHVYVPIADMLGVHKVKDELEDRSIHILDLPGCQKIEEWLEMNKAERTAFLNQMQARIREHLTKEHPELSFEVSGRVKSLYGIHKKHFERGKEFDKIFDIYGLRVITEKETDCWVVQGALVGLFSPVPGRKKDYISVPKDNGYQSLHLTMFGETGKPPFEVQIRSQQMHEVAERGLAVHWSYKMHMPRAVQSIEATLAEARRQLQETREVANPAEAMQSLRSDLAPAKKICLITPNGEMKFMKAGATVLDFAYAIHTDLGNQFVGAIVDGRQVSVDYVMRFGDIVEIQTNSLQSPKREWIQIVTTVNAKNKIRGWFRRERHSENISRGRAIVMQELRRYGDLIPEDWETLLLQVLVRSRHFHSIRSALDHPGEKKEALQEFYALLGYDGVSIGTFSPLIRDECQRQKLMEASVPTKELPAPEKGVIIAGMESAPVKFAKCCCPVPGDDIIGYITRGAVRETTYVPGGVTIHARRCSTVPEVIEGAQAERYVPALWMPRQKQEYPSRLTLLTGLQKKTREALIVALQKAGGDLLKLQTQDLGDGTQMMELTIGVQNRDHLSQIMSKFRNIKGVLSVEER